MNVAEGSYKEYKLDNGLVVAIQKTPTQTIAGRLTVKHGPADEKKGEEGLAHFVEHVITTATEKYDPISAKAIWDSFPTINACTTQEEIYVPVGMLPENVELYLDFVSEMVFRPKFSETKVAEEKQRVIRELCDSMGQPGQIDAVKFNQALYGTDSINTKPIGGNLETIEKATIDDLKGFYKRGFFANNMNLILVGGLPDDIENMIEKYLGDKPSGEIKKPEIKKTPELKEKKIIHTYAHDLVNPSNPNQSSAMLTIGMVAQPNSIREIYPLYISSIVLESRLHKSISERLGISYGIGSDYSYNQFGGNLSVGGKIDPTRSEEAIDAIFKEFDGLKNDPINQDMLDRIKKEHIYSVAKVNETNEGHMNAIDYKLKHGIELDERLELLSSVTPKQIMEVAEQYLPKNREEGKYVLLLRDPLKEK